MIDECLKGGRDPQEHVFMIWISFQTKTGKQGTFSIIRRGGFTKSDLDSVRAVLALIDAQVGFPDGGATRILDQWLPMTSTTVPPSHTSP